MVTRSGKPGLLLLLVPAAALAAAAVVAAPSAEQLPAPSGAAQQALATAVLLAAFAVGLLAPLHGLFALATLAVLEGAVRRWAVNDVSVFLLKDFLVLGVYAAVLPRLGVRGLARPWWLLAPLLGLIGLALLHVPLAGSLSEAAVGLRSYLIYVPLLWVAPALLTSRLRALGLLVLVVALGVAQSTLAVLQVFAGPGVLNWLVSGAEQGVVSIGGVDYLRPAGTFMHVGTLSAFLFATAVCALSLVVCERRALSWAAVAVCGPLAWGVLYTGSRALLGSVLLATAGACALLLSRRRAAPVAGLAASVAAALVLVHAAGPPAGRWMGGVAERLADPPRERVVLPRPGGRTIELLLDPRQLPPPGANSGTLVRAVDRDGRDVIAVLDLRRTVLATNPVDEEPPRTGFLARAAERDRAGGETASTGRAGGETASTGRVGRELRLVSRQRLVGHGTGSMTLGSAYVRDGDAAGEGYYSKLAWELGLPGLALFAWFWTALVVLAGRGLARSSWEAAPALAGVALLVLLAPWLLVTFALDYPVIGVLVYALAGFAVALGTSPSRRPNASARSAENRPGECSRST